MKSIILQQKTVVLMPLFLSVQFRKARFLHTLMLQDVQLRLCLWANHIRAWKLLVRTSLTLQLLTVHTIDDLLCSCHVISTWTSRLTCFYAAMLLGSMVPVWLTQLLDIVTVCGVMLLGMAIGTPGMALVQHMALDMAFALRRQMLDRALTILGMTSLGMLGISICGICFLHPCFLCCL